MSDYALSFDGHSPSLVNMGNANDDLLGHDSDYSLDGGVGENTLPGSAGDDHFDGEAGGKSGDDHLAGGEGDDTSSRTATWGSMR